MDDPFKEFLDAETRKLPFKLVEGRLAWEETEEREKPKPEKREAPQPRLIDAIYLDRELSASVTISKAEANLLRHHVSQLDVEIARLNKVNRLLKALTVALTVVTLLSVLNGFLKLW